jgi:hypothetical protein
MLTREEAGRVWQRMVEAEVRSYYYGDLASRDTRRKQYITGLSFFLASGAAATVIAKTPAWVPVLLSLIVALASAYSIGVGLDHRIRTLTKLHSEWNRLSDEYEHLWHHWQDSDAKEGLQEFIKQARELSELGTEMPYEVKRLERWQNMVYSRFPQPATT